MLRSARSHSTLTRSDSTGLRFPRLYDFHPERQHSLHSKHKGVDPRSVIATGHGGKSTASDFSRPREKLFGLLAQETFLAVNRSRPIIRPLRADPTVRPFSTVAAEVTVGYGRSAGKVVRIARPRNFPRGRKKSDRSVDRTERADIPLGRNRRPYRASGYSARS